MPLDRIEHMPQVLGVRTVVTLREAQSQGFAGSLHKVHELVQFEQRNERIHQAAEILLHQLDERRASGGHRRRLALCCAAGHRGFTARLEQEHLDVRQRAQRALDARLDVIPRQPPKPRAQWRQRDRADAPFLDLRDQGSETRFDILQARLASPVSLCREIDDEPRVGQLPRLEHEHAPGPHLLALASGGVGLEVCRPRLLELQRHAAPHLPDAVHRVDEGLGVGRQQVTSPVFDQRCPSLHQ